MKKLILSLIFAIFLMTIFSVNSLALNILTQYTDTPNDMFAWGTSYNIGQQFQVQSNATIKQFSLLVFNAGTPVVQTCQLCLYSDSGSDTLGSPLACNDTINVSQVITSGEEWINITIPSSDAIANTKYWINAVNCSSDFMRVRGVQGSGNYSFGIDMTYGAYNIYDDLNFMVWGDAYNYNAQISSLEFYPAMPIPANNTLTIFINATDVEVDAINYSIKCSDSDSWGIEDTNATKTCVYGTTGIKNLTARVRDVNHLTYNTFSADINVTNTNSQINSVAFIPATTFHVNQTLIARVNATDIEGDTIVYNFKCNVTDVEADSLIANKSCLYKSVGIFNFTAQVRDGFSATYNSLSQNIIVTPPRFTPEGRSIYNIFIDVGAGFGIFILLIAQSLPALLIALVLITIIVVIGFAIASIFKSKGRK
jgi:hypothetical protein